MISDDENTSGVNRKDAVNIIFVRGEVDDIPNLPYDPCNRYVSRNYLSE